MNALVSLDSILEPAAALVPATLFGTGQVETILAAIEKDVSSEAYDITTPEGRDRIKSVAYKVARSKTTLDDLGKEHVAHIKAQSAAIDKERKTLRDRLDALKDEVRGPLTAWEEAEANRISGHENALVQIIDSPAHLGGAPSSTIRAAIEVVTAISGRSWQEFTDRASAALAEAMPKLNDMLAAAEQHERDAAELEALRKEKAERDARDAEERRKEAEALAAKQRAEEVAERTRIQEAKLAAWKLEQAELAKKQAEEAAAAAVETERVRVARERAEQEIAERKRQENTRHRNKVHAEITQAIFSIVALHQDDHAAAKKLATLITDNIATGHVRHVSINY